MITTNTTVRWSDPNSARNTITISTSTDCWVAKWEGPHASEVISLFGTNTIPTGFTQRATAAEVVTAISRLNPGVFVSAASR